MTNYILSFFCKRLDTSTPYGSIVTDVVSYGNGWEKVIINLTDDAMHILKNSPLSLRELIYSIANGNEVSPYPVQIEQCSPALNYQPGMVRQSKKQSKNQSKKWYQSPRQRW